MLLLTFLFPPLILCLISGVKQLSIARLKSKRNFLENLQERLNEYHTLYQELSHKKFTHYDGSIELFEFIYDVSARANWVNEFILQATFNEMLSFTPGKYCRKKLSYDALAMVNAYEELHQNAYSVDVISPPSKKEILSYFDLVNKALRKLRWSTNQELKEIDIRLETISRSLL